MLADICSICGRHAPFALRSLSDGGRVRDTPGTDGMRNKHGCNSDGAPSAPEVEQAAVAGSRAESRADRGRRCRRMATSPSLPRNLTRQKPSTFTGQGLKGLIGFRVKGLGCGVKDRLRN